MANIWVLLDLKPGADKAEIRKKYKRFVRTEHPDIKAQRGEFDPRAGEKFAKVTAAYREVMTGDEDKFFLESFVARVDAFNAKRNERWRQRAEYRRERAAQRYYARQAAAEAAREKTDEDEDEDDGKPKDVAQPLKIAAQTFLGFLVIVGIFGASILVWLVTKK